MSIKERIFTYIEVKGLSKAEFERKSNLSNGYLNNFKGQPSASKLECILSAFPDINRTWLLTGEGEMLMPSVQHTSVERGINNSGVIKNSTIHQDNRAYYSDSPDVLRAEIDRLDQIIETKEGIIKSQEERIKSQEERIKSQEERIDKLLDIIARK